MPTRNVVIIGVLVLALVGESHSSGDPASPCHLSGGGCLRLSGPPGSHLQATFGGSIGRPVTDPGPLGPGWEHFYLPRCRNIIPRTSGQY